MGQKVCRYSRVLFNPVFFLLHFPSPHCIITELKPLVRWTSREREKKKTRKDGGEIAVGKNEQLIRRRKRPGAP